MLGRRIFIFFFLLAVMLARAGAQDKAYRVAVLPFKSTFNPDYGVFMSDRIAFEFYKHAHDSALGRDRFVLVEADTLSHEIQDQLLQVKGAVPAQLLEYLRREIPANYLLTGTVTTTGIHTSQVLFLDLLSGTVVWKGSVRDNPSWVWTHNREVGEAPALEISSSLGFGQTETPPLTLSAEALPDQVLLQPLFTTAFQALGAQCETRLRTTIAQDGIFSLVPGSVDGGEGRKNRIARLSKTLRAHVRQTTVSDAVLCGSLMTFGKDGGTDNMAIILRLVDVNTGLLVWMGASNGRRVWRWDKMSDIISGAVATLTEDLAQFGAKAAESTMSELRANAIDGAGWADLGDAYLKRGLLKQADEAYASSQKFADAQARAQSGLGQVILRRGGDFDKAVSAFRTAISIDPDHLAAYCHMAQAYLDRGMSDGENFAVEALRRDPAFSLAWRILGDWFLSREEDKEARGAYQKYLALEPDDVEVAERLGRVLLRLKDYAQIDLLIAPMQRAKPEAAELVPIVAIKETKMKRFQGASQLFDRFLSQVDDRERSLYEDVQAVMPESERPAYLVLSQEDQKAYRERFWRAKDPDLSRTYNERQLNHYERVWVARKDFGQEVYPWDQRGAVYIRYGEPEYRSRSGWTPTLPSARVQQVKERIYLELYQYPPEGELIGPVFPVRSSQSINVVQEDAFSTFDQGQQENSPNDGQSRNQPDDKFRNEPGQEAYAPVTLQNDQSIVPWESWVYTDVGGGLVFDFTKEMGGLSGYDFAPIPPMLPKMMKSTIRVAEYAPAIAFQSAVSRQADNFRQPGELPLKSFFYDLADFRGGEHHTRVDVSIGIPLENMLVVTDGRKPRVVLERSMALSDSSYSVVYRQAKLVEFEVDTARVDIADVIETMRQDLPPGTYHFSLSVKDVMSGRSAQLKRDVVVEDYGLDHLALSDLMLVRSVSDTILDSKFRRGNWEVTPNPNRHYRAPKSLAFYCEVYNLTKNEFGQTHYKITTSVTKIDERSAFRAPGGQEQAAVALTYEQVGSQVWERLPLEVDLKNAEQGKNRMVVIVEDLVSGERVSKETTFDYEQ
jgi:GWxTD domain-containing protein